jgi:hypothetical protein
MSNLWRIKEVAKGKQNPMIGKHKLSLLTKTLKSLKICLKQVKYQKHFQAIW